MNSAQAKRLIVVSVFFSASLASITPLTKGHLPDVRIAVGAVLLAIFLLTLAEVTPQIAGALGALVLVSAFFSQGSDIYDTLTRAGGREPNWQNRK